MSVLSLTSRIPNFLLTSFRLIPVNAQIAEKPNTEEETSFSMEFPFEKPVTLSEGAKGLLPLTEALRTL